ncbi:MAG: GNAT family N-acetyltransferase [Anaerolineae bacterium]|nr:GNAT family N-acetyltransferase [Anaerolineae bacterium]
MDILPFDQTHISQAAALFVQSFQTLRRSQPILPDLMANPQRVRDKLGQLVERQTGLVAMEGDMLVGYMGWFLVDGFRGTERKGAYCPVWGHGAADVARPVIYRALYQAAAQQWAAARCGVYAITLMAHDRELDNTWFWNGFGLAVVDAIRSLTPLNDAEPEGFSVRRANLDDVATLAALEAEHTQYYSKPPVLMAPQPPHDEDALVTFFRVPANNYWLAEQDGQALGFMRFENEEFGATEIVSARTTIAITGAFVRPAYRGRGMAVELLDAGLRHYGSRGFARCSVDFEAFNPAARAFWLRFFEPVCYSLMRVPEYVAPETPAPRDDADSV